MNIHIYKKKRKNVANLIRIEEAKGNKHNPMKLKRLIRTKKNLCNKIRNLKVSNNEKKIKT